MRFVAPAQPPRRARKPAFLGCEGDSERGYGAWLNRLAQARGLPIFVHVETYGGGNPSTLVRWAIQESARFEENFPRRKPLRGLLLDAGAEGPKPHAEAISLATKHGIRLIWQKPSHEGFLLHHFEGHEHAKPHDADDAFNRLQKVWKGYRKGLYRKGLDATEYGRVLTRAHLDRARKVEQDLDAFLNALGWN